MATNTELRLVQNTNYMALRQMQEDNLKAGVKVKGLNRILSMAKAGMTKEDIAWVEQQLSEMQDD
ncbi:MAG: hypothetical protein FWD03_04505 [Defluviitaleaceae bacterium]|nr:hypothetical protein [Defluviitaleaceae bacterium]